MFYLGGAFSAHHSWPVNTAEKFVRDMGIAYGQGNKGSKLLISKCKYISIGYGSYRKAGLPGAVVCASRRGSYTVESMERFRIK